MRKIKFRALTQENNVMVYGDLLNCLNGDKRISWDDLDTSQNHLVQSSSIGQFTGLQDKNGVDIYEGDIVTYKRSVGNWTGQTMTTTHKIIFTEEINAFVMEYGSSYIKLRKHWGYEYEVVGNIYQNPELL